MAFTGYALGIVFQPLSTLHALARDPRRFRAGLLAMFVAGVLYSITGFMLYVRGISPDAVWLTPPEDSYYLYEALFNLPVGLAGWLLMASAIYLSPPEGKVSYEDVLGVKVFIW